MRLWGGKSDLETDEEAAEMFVSCSKACREKGIAPPCFVDLDPDTPVGRWLGAENRAEHARKKAVLQEAADREGLPLYFVTFDEESFTRFRRMLEKEKLRHENSTLFAWVGERARELFGREVPT